MKLKIFSYAILTLVLVGCSKAPEQKNALVYEVAKSEFATVIKAKGHLSAANETTIVAPTGSRGPQTLAWLLPEYSQVKKGDVIARFDGEQMQRQSEKSGNKAAIVQQELKEQTAKINKDKSLLEHDIVIVGEEKQFAEDYSIEDERIRSKLDILETLQNVEFLNAKNDYYQWQTTRFAQSSQGELAILEMKEKQHTQKIAMLEANLAQLEITAPHDGLLTHNSNWRGEKPRAGETLWPGQKIAALPDITKMQLTLLVPEREAIDLAKDQSVTFKLLALPEQRFSGKLLTISPFPKSIKRGDPQKYYELTASINEQSPFFQPGLKLNAHITVHKTEQLLIVPKQSVFTEQNAHYVYLAKDGDFIKTQVQLGKHNLSHIEITSGLSPNDVISLIDVKDL